MNDSTPDALVQQEEMTSFATDEAPAGSNNNKPPRMTGLPPTPPQRAADACMDADPRGKAPRSDVPFGYFPPPRVEAAGWRDFDDLFSAYLNPEGLDERHDDGDSGMKTNGADSSENESDDDSRAAGIRIKKGTPAGGETSAAAPIARHANKSLSMDDSLVGKFNFAAGETSNEVVVPEPNSLSGKFTPVEMKKIMADDKLTELALADPKRVKKVLANRQSAARSKQRRMRYTAELKQKVQILQTEATTLAAQLTILQRNSAGMMRQNNELKFRLQAMEQQAQLRDALHETLAAEVQRLKVATAELGVSYSSNNLLSQQIHLNVQEKMFQLQQQQQAIPIPFYQVQQPQQSEAAKNHESEE